MGLLFLTWGAFALVGGIPATIAYACGVRGGWLGWAAALVIAPYWALILTQAIWPIGGLSNFIFRLRLLVLVAFVAETMMLLPKIRNGPVWTRAGILLLAVLSAVPIQIAFPPLPD